MALPVSEAKRDLSRIVREASEHWRVFTIQNAQRRDAAACVVMGEEAMAMILDRFTFTLEWEEDREQGLWSVYVPEIDAWGQGESRESAAQDLARATQDYADIYLDDVPFYVKVGRGDHLPYILRINRTHGDHAEVRRVLGV